MTTERIDGAAVARGGLQSLMGQGGRFLIQALTLTVLARLLVPSDYGVVALATASVSLANVIGDAGLLLAVIRAPSVTREQSSNLFWASTGLGAVLALIACAIAYPLALFFDQPALTGVICALSAAFVVNGMSSQFRAVLNREMRLGQLAIVDVSGQATALVVAIGVALLGGGFWSIVAQQLTVVVVYLVLLVALSDWRPARYRRDVPIREFFDVGVWTMASQISNFLSINAATIALGRLAGPVQVGYYNRAYSLLTLPMLQLAAPVSRAALPSLSQLKGPAEVQLRLNKVQVALNYVMLSVFVMGVAFPADVVRVVFGAGWGPSAEIFRLLAVAGIWQGLGYVYYIAYLALGATRLQFRLGIGPRVVMIVLAFVVAPHGPVAMAGLVAAGSFTLYAISSCGMHAIGLRALSVVGTGLSVLAVTGVGAGCAYLVVNEWLGSSAALLRLFVAGLIYVAVLAVALGAVPPIRRHHGQPLLVLLSAFRRKH